MRRYLLALHEVAKQRYNAPLTLNFQLSTTKLGSATSRCSGNKPALLPRRTQTREGRKSSLQLSNFPFRKNAEVVNNYVFDRLSHVWESLDQLSTTIETAFSGLTMRIVFAVNVVPSSREPECSHQTQSVVNNKQSSTTNKSVLSVEPLLHLLFKVALNSTCRNF